MNITNTILTLKPGIHILRHPKGETATFVIARAPGGDGKMQSLYTPNTNGNVLSNGSDCIVLLVTESDIQLMINSILEAGQTSIPRLRVDQVTLDEDQLHAAIIGSGETQTIPEIAKSPQPRTFNVSATGISLIGHIETIGDVLASPLGILGNPNNSLRLEGFQIVWPDKPIGVEITYSVGIEGLGLMPPSNIGSFAGTRGEARRINEIVIGLTGENLNDLSLSGTAYFSGGFEAPIANNLRISGPSGLEHLVALELNVASKLVDKIKLNPWQNETSTKTFKNENGSNKKLIKKDAATAKKHP